jgi:hypothetical protein
MKESSFSKSIWKFSTWFSFKYFWYTETIIGTVLLSRGKLGRIKHGAKWNSRFIFEWNILQNMFHQKIKRLFHFAPCFILPHFPLFNIFVSLWKQQRYSPSIRFPSKKPKKIGIRYIKILVIKHFIRFWFLGIWYYFSCEII